MSNFRKLRRFLSFIGPGYMVAVGYLDPGNWVSDLAAGSEFGYSLLFMILLSNLMAVLLQFLCVKLGIVSQLDLAQACRKHYSPAANIFLYILCELAIMSCDLAEVIGTAIALNLLFGLPILLGILITALDVLFIMAGWTSKNMHYFEKAIVVLIFAVGLCFTFLLEKTKPDWHLVFRGFLPDSFILTNTNALYISMSIIGSTVMPHNLYLHSHLVKYRARQHLNNHSEETEPLLNEEGSISDISVISESDSIHSSNIISSNINPKQLTEMIKYTNLDSMIALSFALVINASILIVAASSFKEEVGDLTQAYELLVQKLGKATGLAFAIALLLSGQSSTLTGTMAGQICMQGFLGSSFRLKPWLRRLITRILAIVPAVLVVLIKGEKSINDLLILSQVILSLQLPFAVWPLVSFTCSKDMMTIQLPQQPQDSTPLNQPTGIYSPIIDYIEEDCTLQVNYANGPWLKWSGYFIATTLTVFNLLLIVQLIQV